MLRRYTTFSNFSILILLLLWVISAQAQSNYLNSASVALKQGDYERVQELLDKANEYCKEAEKVNQNTAVLLALKGDLEAAIQMLDESIEKDSKNASLYYNRAIIYVKQNNYSKAVDDFEKASTLGHQGNSQSERKAYSLKRQAETKQVEALCKLAEQVAKDGSYDLAHLYYNKALSLRPRETQVLFSQALTGLIQGNPFVSLDALKQIKPAAKTPGQQLEITLLKAYSLARINKMPEAIRLLEHALLSHGSEDMRVRELLSYYYLKLSKYQKTLDVLSGRTSSNANVFVVAGNAALRLKKYSHALLCFKKAKALEKNNLNAAIGIAMCYSHNHQIKESIPFIDSLAVAYPDNHFVWNVKGIIHKDVGLHYKNNFREQQAKAFFDKSAEAFLMAQQLNKHMEAVYNSNRALSLYFQNKKEAARQIWSTNKELSSQNNLALLLASQKDYSSAYQILDALYNDFWTRTKKKHHILDYNRGLARTRETLNHNYKFLTNFKLNQNKPTLKAKNLFELEDIQETNASVAFEYKLAHSDEDCKEKVERRKAKKKKRKLRFKLFKKKKKKYSGDCPKF